MQVLSSYRSVRRVQPGFRKVLAKLSGILSRQRIPGWKAATNGRALPLIRQPRRPAAALHLHLGQEAWGHVIARLLRDLPVPPGPVPEDLVEMARVLDNFYTPTRYPNGHPEGAPFEHYGRLQSEEAIKYARSFIEFVLAQMA